MATAINHVAMMAVFCTFWLLCNIRSRGIQPYFSAHDVYTLLNLANMWTYNSGSQRGMIVLAYGVYAICGGATT